MYAKLMCLYISMYFEEKTLLLSQIKPYIVLYGTKLFQVFLLCAEFALYFNIYKFASSHPVSSEFILRTYFIGCNKMEAFRRRTINSKSINVDDKWLLVQYYSGSFTD